MSQNQAAQTWLPLVGERLGGVKLAVKLKPLGILSDSSIVAGIWLNIIWTRQYAHKNNEIATLSRYGTACLSVRIRTDSILIYSRALASVHRLVNGASECACAVGDRSKPEEVYIWF